MEHIGTIVVLVVLADAGIGAVIGSLRGRALAGAVFGGLLSFIGWLLIYFGPDYSAKRKPAKPERHW